MYGVTRADVQCLSGSYNDCYGHCTCRVGNKEHSGRRPLIEAKVKGGEETMAEADTCNPHTSIKMLMQ